MVECTALEMRRGGNSTGGSNPSLSATKSLLLLCFPLSPQPAGNPRTVRANFARLSRNRTGDERQLSNRRAAVARVSKWTFGSITTQVPAASGSHESDALRPFGTQGLATGDATRVAPLISP